jgi:hypothetical protein
MVLAGWVMNLHDVLPAGLHGALSRAIEISMNKKVPFGKGWVIPASVFRPLL